MDYWTWNWTSWWNSQLYWTWDWITYWTSKDYWTWDWTSYWTDNAVLLLSYWTNTWNVDDLTFSDIDVCAYEGQTCVCSGFVRYGIDDTFTSWMEIDGSIECSNAAFGDVNDGTYKFCECASVEEAYIMTADEMMQYAMKVNSEDESESFEKRDYEPYDGSSGITSILIVVSCIALVGTLVLVSMNIVKRSKAEILKKRSVTSSGEHLGLVVDEDV